MLIFCCFNGIPLRKCSKSALLRLWQGYSPSREAGSSQLVGKHREHTKEYDFNPNPIQLKIKQYFNYTDKSKSKMQHPFVFPSLMSFPKDTFQPKQKWVNSYSPVNMFTPKEAGVSPNHIDYFKCILGDKGSFTYKKSPKHWFRV